MFWARWPVQQWVQSDGSFSVSLTRLTLGTLGVLVVQQSDYPEQYVELAPLQSSPLEVLALSVSVL